MHVNPSMRHYIFSAVFMLLFAPVAAAEEPLSETEWSLYGTAFEIKRLDDELCGAYEFRHGDEKIAGDHGCAFVAGMYQLPGETAVILEVSMGGTQCSTSYSVLSFDDAAQKFAGIGGYIPGGCQNPLGAAAVKNGRLEVAYEAFREEVQGAHGAEILTYPVIYTYKNGVVSAVRPKGAAAVRAKSGDSTAPSR